MKILTKDLKKNVKYYLNGDYYDFIKGVSLFGTEVKLRKFIPAKEIWEGSRGQAAEVTSSDGTIFHVHPKGFLFDEVPITPI